LKKGERVLSNLNRGGRELTGRTVNETGMMASMALLLGDEERVFIPVYCEMKNSREIYDGKREEAKREGSGC